MMYWLMEDEEGNKYIDLLCPSEEEHYATLESFGDKIGERVAIGTYCWFGEGDNFEKIQKDFFE